MSSVSHEKTGIVYLVGAGPGDPGLITLRGVQCLRRADVVLYDYLVNPRIVAHVRPDAQRICLGQHGRSRIWSQDEINERMVVDARQGRTVVRLKGGDPAVFARGAEEAQHLIRHGIRFEIVPGITAALAAGSCAGIPVTHRDFASAVALVTGQENPAKDGSAIDFASLATFPGTLVFYMGVTTAAVWTTALIEAGKSPDTPVAIVRRCSFPDQLSIHCRLGEVPSYIAGDHPIRPPAIVIVGEVVQLAESLAWFEHRPLFGRKILVTRPIDQSESVVDRLEELGAAVFVQPAIEISDPPDWSHVDDAIDRLSSFDWLVFSSSNGVRYFLQLLFSRDLDLRALGDIRIAAIGPGTAEELRNFRLNVDLLPDEFRAEALAAALASQAVGKRFLLARASRGREVLAEQLQAAGGEVEQVVVYTSTDIASPFEDIARLAAEGQFDWITVTSSAIAKSLAHMFGDSMQHNRLISISPITSQTLRDLGLEPSAEATVYTMDGIIDAIVDAESSRQGP